MNLRLATTQELRDHAEGRGINTIGLSRDQIRTSILNGMRIGPPIEEEIEEEIEEKIIWVNLSAS